MALATSTIIAGIGLAAAAAGTAVQYAGQVKAQEASEKQEDLRQQQMQLTAKRQRRQAVREMLINQALAKSNAAVQGVQQGDTSVQGAQAQQFNSAGQNIVIRLKQLAQVSSKQINRSHKVLAWPIPDRTSQALVVN